MREGLENSDIRSYIGDYREGFIKIQLGLQEDGMDIIEKQLVRLNKGKTLNIPDNHDYHQAAIYASLGNKASALEHLRDFTKQIYITDFEEIIPISFAQYDIMFENLWDNEEFKEIIKEDIDKKAAAVAQIRELEKRGELAIE